MPTKGPGVNPLLASVVPLPRSEAPRGPALDARAWRARLGLRPLEGADPWGIFAPRTLAPTLRSLPRATVPHEVGLRAPRLPRRPWGSLPRA